MLLDLRAHTRFWNAPQSPGLLQPWILSMVINRVIFCLWYINRVIVNQYFVSLIKPSCSKVLPRLALLAKHNFQCVSYGVYNICYTDKTNAGYSIMIIRPD